MAAANTVVNRVTAKEFLQFVRRPENENRWFELVRGEVVELPPPGKTQSRICINLGLVLESYARARRSGFVSGGDSVLILERDPDTVRSPDVAFFGNSPADSSLHPASGNLLPVLAAEIISPFDRIGRMLAKIADYQNRGIELIWLIDPQCRNVAVFRAGHQHQMFQDGGELTGYEVLPGLMVKVTDLFRPLDQPKG